MSRTVEIADEIKDILNGETWGTAITAVRKFIPRYKIADLSSGPIVVVVPRAHEITTRTREGGPNDHEYEIDIAVFAHLRGDEDTRDALVEPMVELVEEFAEYFMKHSFVDDGVEVTIEKASIQQLYDSALLSEEGVFGSVLNIIPQEMRV